MPTRSGTRAPAANISMKSITCIPLIALALAAANSTAATDAAADKHWNTSAELGAITTSGNTTGSSFTGKIDAKQDLEVWSNEYVLSGYYKEDHALLLAIGLRLVVFLVVAAQDVLVAPHFQVLLCVDLAGERGAGGVAGRGDGTQFGGGVPVFVGSGVGGGGAVGGGQCQRDKWNAGDGFHGYVGGRRARAGARWHSGGGPSWTGCDCGWRCS